MNNIISKLGYSFYYWAALLIPPLAIFGYWQVEDSQFVSNLNSSIENLLAIGLPGSIVTSGLVIFVGFFLPIYLLAKIKCPKCHVRIVFHYLNNTKKFKTLEDPYKAATCPNCDYEPHN